MNSQKQVFLGRFFSLKWKIFLVISIVIISVNTVYFYYQNSKINEKYEKDRLEQRESRFIMLGNIVRQNAVELQNIGSILPSMYGIDDYLVKEDWVSLRDILSEIWSDIEVTYEVTGLSVFGESGESLFSIGGVEENELLSDAFRKMVIDAVSRTEPTTNLFCGDTCFQVSIVPFLSDNPNVSAIVIFSPVTDAVYRYSELTSSDIAVLVPPKQGEGENGKPTLWKSCLIALTNYTKNLPLLQGIENELAWDAVLERSSPFVGDNKVFDLYASRLETLFPGSDGYFVFLEDITQEQAELRKIAQESFLLSIFGLVASEVALLILLWRPLSRLMQTARVLPLLARGEFHKARTGLLSTENKNKPYIDEIDLVSGSAFSLSRQLEILNREVENSTASLKNNMEKLKEEKEFNSLLVDTAQVIIVATNANGCIERVNKFGRNLTGMPVREMFGLPFSEVFSTSAEREVIEQGLDEVNQQKRRHISGETTFISKMGLQRTIVWVHSYLGDDRKNNATVLSVGTDITDRKEAEKRITWLANHDPLTGLYNRRYFNELFENYLNQSARYGKSGALLFLDLDNFKYINDTKGHQAGDRLIKEVASALRRITRNSDIVSRIGGDEFAIVIPDIDQRGVEEFCTDLNIRLNTAIKPILALSHKVSTSIGIALFPKHGKTVSELLANADIAMYQAKERGRSRWHVFEESEQAIEKIQNQVNWKERIEEALKEDRFVLFFQPIVDVNTRRTSHYEVLLRMLGNEGEIITPYAFIKVAENIGLITEIDRMVLRKTLEFINNNLDEVADAGFSVNLSARTFADNKTLTMVHELLSQMRVKGQRLIFEITETAALQDIGSAVQLIDALHSMGCQIAIDDFGVGFSSFYYLRELPVDYVKIDGSFIQQLAQNPDDQLIVQAMVQIVRGFGKKTIAEYVEDQQTLELLKIYGVDYAQGFHIGVPDTFKEAAEHVALT